MTEKSLKLKTYPNKEGQKVDLFGVDQRYKHLEDLKLSNPKSHFLRILKDPHHSEIRLAVSYEGIFYHNMTGLLRWVPIKKPHLTIPRAIVYGKLAKSYLNYIDKKEKGLLSNE